MVSQDGLQTLDIMPILALDQAQGTEIAHARADQVFRFALDLLHGRRQVMVGVDNISILSIQDGKMRADTSTE